MQKLLEWKNQDWMKGQSAHANLPLGGLFQSIFNFDPFEQGGLCLPSLTPDAAALSTTPKFLTAFNSGGNNYVYALTATKLYQVLRDSPYTVTDVTAQIDNGITAVAHRGHTQWHGKYIYAVETALALTIRSNVFQVASGSDTLLYTNSVLGDGVRFCEGADGNLYWNYGSHIGEIVLDSGTSGNNITNQIDSGFTIRDMVNDGRYLVIFADNNTTKWADRVTGAYRCRIYFWDMVQTDGNSRIVPDAMWEFSDSYLIGGRLTDAGIQFFGSNGLYVTNIVTPPRMIRPFSSSTLKMGKPFNPYQIAYSKGSLYWVDGFTNTSNYVYAYGNPITGQQKIFYIPYYPAVVGVSQCLIPSGNNMILGNDVPSLYMFNTGSTRGAAQITGLGLALEEPVTYSHTKIVLAQKMTSGQSVQVVIQSNNGNVTLSSETQSYNSANPKQTLLFKRKPSSTNQPARAADLTVSVVVTGAALQRVSVYGTPLDDSNNDL